MNALIPRSNSSRPDRALRRTLRCAPASLGLAIALQLLGSTIALAEDGPLPTPRPAGGTLDTLLPPTNQPAPEAGAAPAPPPVPEWRDALFGGTFSGDLRLRFENVHQDAVGPAGRRGQGYAATGRLRLGYTTKPIAGLSGFVELAAGRAADSGTYNSTVSGDASRGVIADPNFAELNQLYAQYNDHGFLLRGGRQRIILDDARFVGNVGWRNDEQTYDAYSVTYTGIDEVTAFYAYLWGINRVFATKGDRRSDSHLINLAWSGAPLGKLVGFAYLLDHRGDADLFDSDTFGFRYLPTFKLSDDDQLSFIFSYARQIDAGVGHDFKADYYLVEAFLNHKPWNTTFGIGYEVLGSDSGAYGFQTPLATLHAFNGYADLFLTTPAFGLEDIYAYASTKLPWDVNGKVIGHVFDAEDADAFLGWEVDAILTKKIVKNLTALAKVSYFEGEASIAAAAPSNDTVRFWVQLELKF